MHLKKKSKISLETIRKYTTRLILIIVLISLTMVCINLKSIFYVTKFISLMENIHPPAAKPNSSSSTKLGYDEQSAKTYVNELEQIACYFVGRSEKDRGYMINVYTYYMNLHLADRYYEQVLNMYVLQRLVFDVPSQYPKDDTNVFVSWSMMQEANRKDMYDLLWPLEYENGQLSLKVAPPGLYSYSYQADKEYEYLKVRFPLRVLTNCKQ